MFKIETTENEVGSIYKHAEKKCTILCKMYAFHRLWNK